MIGYLPIRLPNISYFPKKGSYLIGTWTNEEILNSLKHGYKIINIQFIITYDEINNPFKNVMKNLYNKRLEKDETEFNKYFYKSIMNGGIGKFAQTRIGQEIVFDNVEKIEDYILKNYEVLGGITENIKDTEKNRIMKYKKIMFPSHDLLSLHDKLFLIFFLLFLE